MREYLSANVFTIRKLIREGQLPLVQLGQSRKHLIDRIDLDCFIEKNKSGIADEEPCRGFASIRTSKSSLRVGSGNGIRTRVSTLRGWRPEPLVDTAGPLSYRASDFSAIGVTLADLNWPTLMRASFTSSVVLMLYRSKIASVLWPLIFIAVLRSAPAFIRLRDALRRKSCGTSPVYFLISGSNVPSPRLSQVLSHSHRMFLKLNTRSFGFGNVFSAVYIDSTQPSQG